jgi:hypothetical protein
MSDSHAADGMVGSHGSADDHGDTHGHDDHGHGSEALGPVDWRAWGAGVLGMVLGLGVALSFLLAGGSAGLR